VCVLSGASSVALARPGGRAEFQNPTSCRDKALVLVRCICLCLCLSSPVMLWVATQSDGRGLYSCLLLRLQRGVAAPCQLLGMGRWPLARWLGWVCYNWHGPGTVAACRVFGREATRGASSLEQQAWAPPALVEAPAPFSYTVCPTPAISVPSSSIGKIPSAIVISPRRSLR
jgi:hypothetical protein